MTNAIKEEDLVPIRKQTGKTRLVESPDGERNYVLETSPRFGDMLYISLEGQTLQRICHCESETVRNVFFEMGDYDRVESAYLTGKIIIGGQVCSR